MDAKTKSLTELVKAFESLHVLVIGEAMLDSYLIGTSGRICQEAPVPVVSISNRDDAPGGAANTAVNVASLGADVTFLSVIGQDNEGQILRQELEKCGINTAYLVAHPQRQTLAKCRVVAASQMLVRFDQGSTEPLDSQMEQALIIRLQEFWPHCEAVIISDYKYGILTPNVIACLASLQQASPRVLVADSKDLTRYQAVGITACKPNYEEATHLLGLPKPAKTSERVELITQNADQLLALTGAQMVTVTLDTEGALLLERNQTPYRTYAQPSPNSRAAGAGDTFVSAMTLALAAHADSTTAIEVASMAAAVVVSRDGTSACTANELCERFVVDSRFIEDWERLLRKVELYRQHHQRIVFANGCFDILHRGHIAFLNQAKALGDVLIVAINSDESVRHLKGAGRPINTLEDRVLVLEALSCIDHIVAFAEDTPSALLELIRPDIFVKGGNYMPNLITETPVVESYGGQIKILPYLPERSTSLIIKRIKSGLATPLETNPVAAVFSK